MRTATRPSPLRGDFSTPNEIYFAHADWVINEAASRGLLVLLAPAYLGFGCGGEGWCQEMNANGATKAVQLRCVPRQPLQDFQEHPLGPRRRHQREQLPGTGDIMRAVINGIKSVDGRRVHTGHCGPGFSGLDCYDESYGSTSTQPTRPAPPAASRTRTDYNRARVMPFFYIKVSVPERRRFGHLPAQPGVLVHPRWLDRTRHRQQSDLEVRIGVAAGAGLDRRAEHGEARRIVRDRAPGRISCPDYLHQVVTAGFGNISNATYVAAARAADGSMAIAYLPGGGTITVDISRLSGPATARCPYHPVAGTFTSVAGSPSPNTGSRNFTTSGTNAGGSVDWVLVLERTP